MWVVVEGGDMHIARPPLANVTSPALQSDNPQNPHGLAHAWTLLARLLNALPANRVTATAVDATLKVVGWVGGWAGGARVLSLPSLHLLQQQQRCRTAHASLS